MKRFSMFLFVLVLIAAVCFAQTGAEPSAPAQPPASWPLARQTPVARQTAATAPKRVKKNLDLEISLGVPVHFTNDIEGPAESSAAIAPGMGLTYNINKLVGISLDADFAYSQNTSVVDMDAGSSNHYSIFSANFMLGPVLYLYSDDRFKIPLTIDLHIGIKRMDFSKIDDADFTISQNVFLLGPALQIGVQYHFTNTFYIISRAGITCDFASFGGSTIGGTDTDRASTIPTWGIKPLIGLGLQL